MFNWYKHSLPCCSKNWLLIQLAWYCKNSIFTKFSDFLCVMFPITGSNTYFIHIIPITGSIHIIYNIQGSPRFQGRGWRDFQKFIPPQSHSRAWGGRGDQNVKWETHGQQYVMEGPLVATNMSWPTICTRRE